MVRQAVADARAALVSAPGATNGHIGRFNVRLIVFYVIFMITGDIADYLIGLGVERVWPVASLPVFLLLYFFFLWVSWILAVKVTAPKGAISGDAASA
jgi:hypothetical protein